MSTKPSKTENDIEKVEVPKRDARDIRDSAHTAGKALSGLAGLGPLYELILGDPQAKRDEAFKHSVVKAINELIDRGVEIDIEALADDPNFQATVAATSRAANETASEQKRKYLISAACNTALGGGVEEFMRDKCLRLLSDLSPIHVQMLTVLDDPPNYPTLKEMRRPPTGGTYKMLRFALPELNENDVIIQSIYQDLSSAHLVRLPVATMTTHGDATLAPMTTDQGKTFLAFIDDPLTLP